MIAEKQKEKRANLIQKYYNGIYDYEYQAGIVDGDGTIITGDKDSYLLEARYKHINDLINIYYDELVNLVGYAYSATANLSESEVNNPPNLPPTNKWWQNCDYTIQQTEFFYNEIDVLSVGNLVRYNGSDEPNQRHPFLMWNQSNAAIESGAEPGSLANMGWLNADYNEVIDATYNPFAVQPNYRMNQPVEYYGNTNNLLWGKIIYNGVQAYRANLGCGGGDATDDGFVRLDDGLGTIPVSSISDVAGSKPSSFELLRYTFWGSGANTGPVTENISLHAVTGTGTGTFYISGSTLLSEGWWAFYTANLAKGWILKILSVVDNGGVGWDVTYEDALWPNPPELSFNGPNYTVKDPTISNAIKTGAASNGLRNIWTYVYNSYSPTFISKINEITNKVDEIILDLSAITNYNYEVVNDTCINMDTDAGKSEASTMYTTLSNWLSDWKTDVNDTGSGATYTINDTEFADIELDKLVIDLRNLMSFAGNDYSNASSGIIKDRLNEVYEILGRSSSGRWYTAGPSEGYKPVDIPEAVSNNSGSLIGSTLYYWRWFIADKRLNRGDGSLSTAYRGYASAYNAAIVTPISEIKDIENYLDNIIINASTYDLTPLKVLISTQEKDKIVLEWDTVISSSSYRIERKSGISGSWIAIETQWEYHDPGMPPIYDFQNNPPTVYEDIAATRGYQEFGLVFSDSNATPPLSNAMDQYSFNISINGDATIEIVLVGADCQSWLALSNMINEIAETDSHKFTSEIIGGDIRLISNTYGSSSSVSITAGTTGISLLTALSATPNIAVPGDTSIEEGKVYYYRIRVNNGHNETLGGGTISDKDWDSISDWHTTEYSDTSDKYIHGEAGTIEWIPPSNVKVGGIHSNGVTTSNLHARVEWSASLNANKYKIYRSTLRTSGYVYIGDTVNTYYEDINALPGLPYWYRITSVASSEHEYYDDSDSLSIEFESSMSDLTEDSNGKRLWETITLSATENDTDKVTLDWNSLATSNGYVIYRSNSETGRFNYISKDDGRKLVVNSTVFEDRYPAEQFMLDEFASVSDGIPDTNYTANTRYYLIIIVTDTSSYSTTMKQYYITSPSSGVWTCQNMVNSLSAALADGLNNVDCNLIELNDPHAGPFYRIKFTSKAKGTSASIRVTVGTFFTNWIELFSKGLARAATGYGATLAVPSFYKVQGVEVIGGRIVRESELSNIAKGLRPIEIPS